MLRTRILFLACTLGLTASARADTVEIDYDFSDSTMSFVGLIDIPPGGTIMSMGATTVLPAIKTAGGATSVQTGSAQLKSLTVDMTISDGAPFIAFVTGNVIVSQVGTSTGPFTNTRTVMFGGPGTGTTAGLSLFVSAHLNCFGLGCAGVGDFPISVVRTQPPPPGQAFSIFLGHLNTPGAATVSGTLPVSIPPETTSGDPVTGTVFLTGTEISRTYHVPEPGSLAQLIPGVIGLAGVSRGRRRNREKSQ